MTRPIVLVGGGLAAQRCAETLRRSGYGGPLTVVCAEPEPPYDRPPLSKELLAGEISEEAVRLRPDAWYRDNEVELVLGAPATGLDAGRRELVLGDRRLAFRDLVIATGADARALPGGALTLRTLADTAALRERLRPEARLAIVGGGLIGLEVASTARKLGADVVVLERGPAPLAAVLGEDVAGLLARMHAEAGVEIRTGVMVESIAPGRVTLAGEQSVEADAVLVAIGGAPATGWLAGSELADPRGIPVDEGARTGIAHVYAAGDCARPWDPHHREHRLVDHWEAAARQGTAAARSILGLPVPAAPPHSFWSDQHGVRLQMVGSAAGAARVVIEGSLEARDLAARYHAADGALLGAFLLNRPRELPAIRKTLTEQDRRAA